MTADHSVFPHFCLVRAWKGSLDQPLSIPEDGILLVCVVVEIKNNGAKFEDGNSIQSFFVHTTCLNRCSATFRFDAEAQNC
jgi:hypothetical protein